MLWFKNIIGNSHMECYICRVLYKSRYLAVVGEICLCQSCVYTLVCKIKETNLLTLEEKHFGQAKLVRHIITKYPILLWMLREAKHKW